MFSRGEVGDSVVHSPIRQDSTSDYSNMSDPDKLEIDTKEPVKAEEQENQVSNVCVHSTGELHGNEAKISKTDLIA